MKVALVHDWLDTYRGGEKVLEKIADLFPGAPIYTLFYDSTNLPSSFSNMDIRFSPKINRFRKFRKLLLPLLPSMMESFLLNEYDLIISSSSCVAKGVIPNPTAKHLCYIHSPMRYVWDQRDQYFGGLKNIPGLMPLVNLASTSLRQWDVSSSNRVDQYVSNSNFVKQRVEKYYRRDSEVIHPPVDIQRFINSSANSEKSDYFLVAGAMVSYKRVDLAIKACKQANKKLIIAGSGPMEKHLRQIGGNNVQFELNPSQDKWAKLLAGAQALLFPGLEDFGIVPIEAMASGTPVIAFGKGGALDYIKPGVNGGLFSEQTVESLAESLDSFDSKSYDSTAIRNSTKEFHEDTFKEKMKVQIEKLTGESI